MNNVLFYEFFHDDEEENRKKEEEVYRKQRESDKKVYIAVGISGSGKSTRLAQMFPADIIVSTDAIRRELTKDISDQSQNSKVWDEAPKRMLEILERKGRVVLDATNVVKYRRICFMSKFNGARKTAIVFPVDLDDAIANVKKDIGNGVIRSNVPEGVIRRQFKNLNKGLESLQHEFNEVVEILYQLPLD